MKALRLRLALILVSSVLLVHVADLHAQTAATPALMPMPAHIVSGEGQLLIDGSFSVVLKGTADPRLASARKRFIEALARETGIPLRADVETPTANFVVETAAAGDTIQRLGEDESYRLEVTSTRALLTAKTALGALRGLQTFLQLVKVTPQGFAAPAAVIEDQPRFPWRGLLIDSSRHFMPVATIERNLDGMEAVKLNVLHWHLSDDQGFRVESKVLPLLQKKGSAGLFYTQAQIHDVIHYAHERGIRVVPEFDMPCHTTAMLAAYPSLGSSMGPYEVFSRFGLSDSALDPTRESTYLFLDKFVGEMATLFPDAYFHIGGDECSGKEWDANPRIQSFMRAHKLKNNAALQSYFTAKVQKLVAHHHKVMVGWDEVLQPDTPKDVVIQSWRGQTALAVAARQGNRGLLSNGFYIDLYRSAALHYAVDPLTGEGATLTPDERARVLGGEATMWAELVTPENIDNRIWPRTAAIAERLWSPQEVRDPESMYERMAVLSQKLEYRGLEHKLSTMMMIKRMIGAGDPQPLKVLAATLQPVEGYARGGAKNYTQQTPLNRLVDAIPPESDTARHFAELANLIAAGKATPPQWQEARDLLTLWRDNDAKLQPSLAASEITTELIPASHALAQVAALGLTAMDDLQNHRVANPATLANELQMLKTASAKPIAEMRNMVASPVEALLKASGAAAAN